MADQQLDLPPWLSYVTYTDEGGIQTGLAQLPLTYTGPAIPLEWPWTSPGGDGGMRVSLLGGTGFQTLPPMTITAVMSTGGQPAQTQGAPNGDDGTESPQATAQTTVPLVTTDQEGQPTTVPGAISTRPDGLETTVPAPTALPTATILQTGTDANGQTVTTGAIPGLVSSIPDGGGLTTIPATASTLPDGQTTVVPISPSDTLQPVTTTATLPDSSLTTATGFISTQPDGETTAVFPSLSTLSSTSTTSKSSSSSGSSSRSSGDSSASSSESTGIGAGNGNNNGLSSGQIAGIVVGSILAALILFALLALCCVRRNRRRRYQDTGAYTRFGNAPAAGRHQRLSDRTDDSEADIDVDPSQLFVQPPTGYTGVGALPGEMREVERGSNQSGDSRRSLGLMPPSRFSSRPFGAQRSGRPTTAASYQTVSSSDLDSLVSSSLHGSPRSPPAPAAPSNSPVPDSGAGQYYDPSSGYNNTTYTSSNITNPFSPYTDSQPSQEGDTSATTLSAAPQSYGFSKALPTIPASPEESLKESPVEPLHTQQVPRASGHGGGGSKSSLQGGMTGLGLGMFFGLVGQGRRAISLNGTDDLAEREPKESTTSSDPLPIRTREPIFSGQASPRHRQPAASTSSSDDEGDESAGLLDDAPGYEGGDPLVTRWSRTTFGKKIGTSSHAGSDTQSMVASILSRRSGQPSQLSGLKGANSDGRRVVSEGGSVSGGSRRTQNSSDGTQSSSGSSSRQRRKNVQRPEVPVRQPTMGGGSVLETAEEEEEGPSIRLVSRSQSSVNKLD